jgi:hypothetical protein
MNKTKAERDLAFIKQVMEDSKKLLLENGLPYVIFGALSIVCTALTYGAIFLQFYASIIWIWVAFLLMGTSLIFFILRKYKREMMGTFASEIYGYVWMGMTVFIVINGACLFFSGKFDLGPFLAFVAGVLGAAYFISSTITRKSWMFALSFVWWAGAFVMVSIDSFYAPLVLACFVLVCELIPGVILHLKWIKSHRPSGKGEEAVPQVDE